MALSAYEQELRRRIARNNESIRKAFEQAIIEISYKAARLNYKGQPFRLADYPLLKRQVDNLIERLQPQIYTLVVNSIEASWSLSNHKNDVLVDQRLAGARPVKEVGRILYDPNYEAMQQFIKRREQGMNLSDRVWNTVDPSYKKELEIALGLGIANGTSAKELATQLQQYLVSPDKLFRKVRGEDGKLHLSAGARAYHPGQGVYRSSYKNALRLAATEINMAYRTADFRRWQKLPFVTGIEVHLSGSNHPKKDICDELQGEYPKEFLFRGWHPWCRCFATPKMMSDDDYENFETGLLMGSKSVINAMRTGVAPVYAHPTIEPPENFLEWMIENRQTISGWASKPYFIGDNPQFTNIKYLNKFELELVTQPEAEKRIAELTGAIHVNLDGLSRNVIKTVLRVIENESKVGKLHFNKFYTYKPSTKGIYSETASAAYNFIDNELVINMDRIIEAPLRPPDSFEKQIEQLERLLHKYSYNPYAQAQIRADMADLRDRIERGEKPKVFNQMTTYKNFQDRIAAVMYHEIGHARYFQLYMTKGDAIKDPLLVEMWGQELFGDDYPRAANSMYGESSLEEFFAEWYSWYRLRGEKGIPDSVMRAIRQIEEMAADHKLKEFADTTFSHEGITETINYQSRLKSLAPVYSPEGIARQLESMDRITKAEAQSVTSQIIGNLGLKIDPENIKIDVAAVGRDQTRAILGELNQLSKEYSSPFFAADPQVNKIAFEPIGNLDAQITWKETDPGFDVMNFGGKSDITEWHLSRTDPGKSNLHAAVHEFGHVLTNRQTWVKVNSGFAGIDVLKSFWREAMRIYAQYQREIEGYFVRGESNNKKFLTEIFLSEYGDTNEDEFVAEAFAEYKLCSHPTKYAQKIGKLVDKYFKR